MIESVRASGASGCPASAAPPRPVAASASEAKRPFNGPSRRLPIESLTRRLHACRPGSVPYGQAFNLQKALVQRAWTTRPENEEDTLLLLEHPAVITIGRRGSNDHILAAEDVLASEKVEVAECNRGGDVTYHGPGQVVGYPIFDLNAHGRDVHGHMRRLEEVVIRALGAFGVSAGRRDGLTGVWVEERKIASIGIAVSHWIAYHGFALNVAPRLEHFGLIVPCGLQGVHVTSIEAETGRATALRDVEDELIHRFVEVFRFREKTESRALPDPECELTP